MLVERGRILGLEGGDMVDDTDLRLVRTGVLVGMGGAIEALDPFLSLSWRLGIGLAISIGSWSAVFGSSIVSPPSIMAEGWRLSCKSWAGGVDGWMILENHGCDRICCIESRLRGS